MVKFLKQTLPLHFVYIELLAAETAKNDIPMLNETSVLAVVAVLNVLHIHTPKDYPNYLLFTFLRFKYIRDIHKIFYKTYITEYNRVLIDSYTFCVRNAGKSEK
jgi:hypothetical protein